MEPASTFAYRLDRVLRERGISQNELARALSVEGKRVYTSVVNRWLPRSGQEDWRPILPSGEYMLRLPEILGVDGHWLLTGEGEMLSIPPAAKALAFDLIARIADRVRQEGAVPVLASASPQPRPQGTSKSEEVM